MWRYAVSAGELGFLSCGAAFCHLQLQLKKKKSKKKIETIFYPERLRQQEANAVISLVSREIKSGRLGAAWLRHHLAVIPPCVPGARHPEEPVFPMELPGPPATLQQLVISRTTPWFRFAVCDIWL